jgi:hypothetical protein
MAAPLKMGSWHQIGQDDWEPQRTNNFEIVFPNLNGLTSIDTGLAMPGNANELLTLSVVSATVPSTQIDVLKVWYGNDAVNFAGRPTYSDIEVVIGDKIGIATENILMSWHKKVLNPKTEAVGRASGYKYDAYLNKYSPDGVLVGRYQLRGCFPTTVTPGQFSNEDNSLRNITATFSVDVAIPLDIDINL